MEVTSIITGSWFPRTKLHLKEYLTFLKTGASHLPIDPESLHRLREALTPSAIAYNGGRFDHVTARFGEFATTYYEDGLLLVRKEVADVDADLSAIRSFYRDALAPALARLYSIGAPAVTPSAPHIIERTVLFLADGATEKEVDALMAGHGDGVHYVARDKGRTVYFADNHILIDDGGGDDAFTRQLVGELVFFREYEHKLRHFLDLHRSVWESIEGMRAKESLSLKELPAMRDKLLDYHRDLSILRARLAQMDAYLDERRAQIDDLGWAEDMRELEAYRFGKMRMGTSYIERLWTMLDDYVSSTVEITGLMYQENLQREINLQQFIFLLGSIAAIITLGAIPGSSITLRDPDGGIVSKGIIKAFGFRDLLVFGGAAFVATLVVFTVVRPLVSSFKRIKMTSLFGGLTRSNRLKNDEEE